MLRGFPEQNLIRLLSNIILSPHFRDGAYDRVMILGDLASLPCDVHLTQDRDTALAKDQPVAGSTTSRSCNAFLIYFPGSPRWDLPFASGSPSWLCSVRNRRLGTSRAGLQLRHCLKRETSASATRLQRCLSQQVEAISLRARGELAYSQTCPFISP